MPQNIGEAAGAEQPVQNRRHDVYKAVGVSSVVYPHVVCWECLDHWITQRFLRHLGCPRNDLMAGQNPVLWTSDKGRLMRWLRLHHGHDRIEFVG